MVGGLIMIKMCVLLLGAEEIIPWIQLVNSGGMLINQCAASTLIWIMVHDVEYDCILLRILIVLKLL